MTSTLLRDNLENSKIVKAVILGLLIAFSTTGIPYLFLRDLQTFYGSYLYWIILTIIVIAIVSWRVSKWGETK